MMMTGLRTLRDLVEERAEAQPQDTAWVFESGDGVVETLTYAEVNERTNRVARGFQRLGVGKGDKVALRLTNRSEFLLSWFALAKIGAVSVPTITTITQSETEFTLERADIGIVVTDPIWVPLYEEARSRCPLLHTIVSIRTVGHDEPEGTTAFSRLLADDEDYEKVPLSPTDDMQMMFTSGSTSAPKCVIVTHSNMLAAGERLARSLGLRRDDRNINPLPFFHANCQGNTVISSFTAGGTAVVLERFSVHKYWSQVRRHDATIGALALPGAMLALDESELDTAHRMRWAFAGTPLPREKFAEFERRFGVLLVSGYGLTEAMVDVVMTPLYAPRVNGAVGLPTPGRDVHILDEKGHEVAQGQQGEICVVGEPGLTVMKGYYKDAAATAEALHDGYLFTGDLGHFDERGYLYFDGRKKDIIKRAGENVASLEVELVLTSHPAVIEAAVFGVPDEILGEAVLAVVVLQSPGAITADDLLEFSRASLTPFKVPREIEFREELPRSAIGKIVKPRLREQAMQRLGVAL